VTFARKIETPVTAPRTDYVIEQDWQRYTPEEHATWGTLFRRQSKLLPGRACAEFMDGLKGLHLDEDQIPDFRRLNEHLHKLTGWTIVAVPNLVPDDIFFGHLANRRFPAGRFIRRPDQLNYLQEPDVFHDVFGHAPMLTNPVFADYMQAYGKAGLAADAQDSLEYLARLYWYTVEFGLIERNNELSIYGSGIVSSYTESRYALEDPRPKRVAFELKRVMRTKYRIDDLQELYFVIDSFDQLPNAIGPRLPRAIAEVKGLPSYAPTEAVMGDVLVDRR
jgi:phenylalanine-4-hydroxylase